MAETGATITGMAPPAFIAAVDDTLANVDLAVPEEMAGPSSKRFFADWPEGWLGNYIPAYHW